MLLYNNQFKSMSTLEQEPFWFNKLATHFLSGSCLWNKNIMVKFICGVFLLPVLTAQASPLAALLPLYLMLALMSHFVSCTVLSPCEIPVCKLCAPF